MTETSQTSGGVLRRGEWREAQDRVALAHDRRLLQEAELTTERGRTIALRLPEATALVPGDALRLADGSLVEVIAAPERLIEVTGPELGRALWHLGCAHAPCQIGPDRALVAADPGLAALLRRAGAGLREVTGPFVPEPRLAAEEAGPQRRAVHLHVSHFHDAEEEEEPAEEEPGAPPPPLV